MRRELDTTPTAVRAGRLPQWQRLFERRPPVRPGDELPGDAMLKPQYIEVPTLPVLTATGRGMDQGDMSRAAKQACGELVPAVQAADLLVRMKSCIALCPDTPAGPDDQQARFLGGVVFDHSLAERDAVPAPLE
jgi:AraC family transcriptional regulator